MDWRLNQETTFNDKLYGGLEQLTTTAQFITSIGLVVWILQFVNFENEEEEEYVLQKWVQYLYNAHSEDA